jgi:glycine/D-amino acid oxidase-like deaminating enzyme
MSQLPRDEKHWGDGEIIFGGGGSFAPQNGMSEVGNTDESTLVPEVTSYIGGAVPVFFGESNWGAEGTPSSSSEEEGMGKGRVKTMWAGIMGLSVDGPPWVGKLTRKLTPREVIPEGGGEWVSAGYSGEGLVHAWGCARACAMSVLGLADREGEELPKEFMITEARVKKSGSAEQIFATLEEP